MRFSPPPPLSAFSRVFRSVTIVTLLIGNLFPIPQGFPIMILTAALCVILIAHEIIRKLPIVHAVVFVPVFFGIIALHAIVIPPSTIYGNEKLQDWLTTTLVSALAASLLRDRRSFQTFAVVWVIAATFLALMALAGFQGGRADLFGANPIWLGRAMASGLLVAIWLLWKKLSSPAVTSIVIVVLIVGLVAAGSRGPLLGAVVGGIVLALFSGRGRLRRVLLIIGSCAMTVWAIRALPLFQGSRFEAMLEDGGALDASGRSEYWSMSLRIINLNPGGVGFGGWAAWAGQPRNLYPHNIFLEIFAELGIAIGILVVVVILAVLIFLALKSSGNPVALLVLTLLAAEIVYVNFSGDLNARALWFFLAAGFLIVGGSVIDSPLRSRQGPSGSPEGGSGRRRKRPNGAAGRLL